MLALARHEVCSPTKNETCGAIWLIDCSAHQWRTSTAGNKEAQRRNNPLLVHCNMLGWRNRRRSHLLVVATAMVLHSCFFHRSRRPASYFVDGLLLWRSSNKRFGNHHQGSRRRPFSLHLLFETAEEGELTKHHHGYVLGEQAQGATKTEQCAETDNDAQQLYRSNQELRQKVESLEEEVRYLRAKASTRIVLESFEGENRLLVRANDYRYDDENNYGSTGTNTMATRTSSKTTGDSAMWCDELEDESCPVEPMISFTEALRDRALWLVGLLMLQSFSGIILAHNEGLLARHPVSTCPPVLA
jgi:hypothetical protein